MPIAFEMWRWQFEGGARTYQEVHQRRTLNAQHLPALSCCLRSTLIRVGVGENPGVRVLQQSGCLSQGRGSTNQPCIVPSMSRPRDGAITRLRLRCPQPPSITAMIPPHHRHQRLSPQHSRATLSSTVLLVNHPPNDIAPSAPAPPIARSEYFERTHHPCELHKALGGKGRRLWPEPLFVCRLPPAGWVLGQLLRARNRCLRRSW